MVSVSFWTQPVKERRESHHLGDNAWMKVRSLSSWSAAPGEWEGLSVRCSSFTPRGRSSEGAHHPKCGLLPGARWLSSPLRWVLCSSPSPACASLEVCSGPTKRRMPAAGNLKAPNQHENSLHERWRKTLWSTVSFSFTARTALRITFPQRSIPAWSPQEK